MTRKQAAMTFSMRARFVEDGRALEFVLTGPQHNYQGEELLGRRELERYQAAREQLRSCLRPTVWARPTAGPAQVEQAGRALAELFPSGARTWLAKIPVDAWLELDTDTPGLEWELCRLEGGYLWQNCLLTRAHTTTARPTRQQERPRLLIVSDPLGLQSQARGAAEALARSVSSVFEVDRLVGPQASAQAVEAALRSGDYGWLHLQTLAESDHLWLADRACGFEELVGWQLGAPSLVSLHLDWLKASSAPMVPLWLEAGTGCLLDFAWDVEPTLVAAMLRRFGRELCLGNSLGRAWRTARQGLPHDDPSQTAQAARMYGCGRAVAEQLQPLTGASSTAATLPVMVGADYLLVVTEGPEIDREIQIFARALEGRQLTLGGPGALACDLEIDDATVKNRVAALEVEEGKLRLHSLTDDSDLRVNGLPVFSAVELQDQAEVRVGRTCIQVRCGAQPPADPRPSGRRFYQLEVVEGSDRGRRCQVSEAVVVVGRQQDCDLQLTDPAVSRQHFALVLRDGGLHLSRVAGGLCVVNGVPVEGEQRVRSGDRIQVSPSTVLEISGGSGARAQS
ncbi:MAG: FHA domain-containing protein [Candidatus Eremiobacteraeota bacterium]|nr:FHA domain-containing protein [Candidatus Eremiobacteraeota bacterium]